ncbi:MAG: chemotaxis protein CheW [Rhodocyclaceae bacterium]
MRYKNLEIDSSLATTIRHMDSVNEYRETLQGLQSVWDNLNLLGQLSGVGADMSSTRQAFHELTETLINQLGIEVVRKTELEMGAKAQVAIDILIRNLYERTADIGFLATDDDVCAYLQDAATQRNRFQTLESQAEATLPLRNRFAEYVAKYSVYHDIVLLDTEGRVLVRLDDKQTVECSTDALVADALARDGAYVERFGEIDLLPGHSRSLVYAASVRNAEGNAIGVLCLCFRFDNEMEGIFANLVMPEDWSVVVLLDAEGRVLASSNCASIQVGTRMQPVLDSGSRIVRFGSNEFLATSRLTQGYQGYMGPGWIGHVMLPLQHAFATATQHDLADIDTQVRTAITQSPSLFAESLRAIPRHAEHIQNDLNRSVWNGSVSQCRNRKGEGSTFPRALLREISSTGRRTQEAFESSIENLYETVVSARLHDSSFLAQLAIDIMDRNLYERANDCRWWALTSDFRKLLEAPEMSEDERTRMASILAYINSLYTVYDRLLVFDAQGCVVASSRAQDSHLHGRNLQTEWVRRSLAIDNSQGYVVSSFSASDLYDGRPTYIYAAAIRSADSTRTTGGVGIVFDSAPQFQAILRDCLPRDARGETLAGSFALFVDEQRRVIACSDDSLAPGKSFDIDPQLIEDALHGPLARIVRLGDSYYAVGASPSCGYREYKGDDDAYRNPVVALLCMPLCLANAVTNTRSISEIRLAGNAAGEEATAEVATFYVGEKWFGLRPAQVMEARELTGMTNVPGAGSDLAGYLMFRSIAIPVFDLRRIVEAGQSPTGKAAQVIVLNRGDDRYLGIIADGLGGIVEVQEGRLQNVPEMIGGASVIGEAILTSRNAAEEDLLLVLSAERIFNRLAPGTPEMPTARVTPRPVNRAA